MAIITAATAIDSYDPSQHHVIPRGSVKGRRLALLRKAHAEGFAPVIERNVVGWGGATAILRAAYDGGPDGEIYGDFLVIMRETRII